MAVSCPNCNADIDVSEIAKGENAVCPKCGRAFPVPPTARPAEPIPPRIVRCLECTSQLDVTGFATGSWAVCTVCGFVFSVPAPLPPEMFKQQRIWPCPDCRALLDVTEFEPGAHIVCPQCRHVVAAPPFAPRAMQAQSHVSFWANAAVATAGLAAILFSPPAVIASLFCGLVALWRIRHMPKRLLGRNRTYLALTAGMAVLMIYILLLPSGAQHFASQLIPPGLVTSGPEAGTFPPAAKEAGKAAPRTHVSSGTYAITTQDLLVYNKNLLDDAGVTFRFGRCNSSGFTFVTMHAKGSKNPDTKSGRKEFLFTD